ncbi:MAG: ribosome biogenesis GTPase Der, partial [Syntrophobacteria bacterium]
MEERQTNNNGSSVIPIVAIVGRPNVGKSTLFNRLCRDRRAIVDDTPGITRDRLIAQVTWGDRSFCLVDTGGIEEESGQPHLKTQVRQQAQMALEEADLVIFLADGKEGLHSGDATVVDLLRRSGKPVIYGVNKIDGPEQENASYEFYGLGVEKLFPISAAHGYGVRDMMDTLVEMLPPETTEEEAAKGIRVAIIGRPNVGKSSLLNRIMGSERVLVSDLPGTTRDAIDVSVTLNDQAYVLIDTPGIRRRSKTRDKIEKFSVLKALKSIDRSQVAVLLLDGSEGVTAQDVRIAGYIHERGRGGVVVINKWDLVQQDPNRVAEITQSVNEALKFMPYAPQLRMSALTGKGVSTLLPTLNVVFSQYCTRVQTSAVNEVLTAAVSRHEPPMHGRRRTKILYGAQVSSQPPTFVLFVSYPEAMHFSYQRYLTNQIRKAFSLDLTPVRLIFRGREKGKAKRR